MKYCKKCHKKINYGEETYRDLCWNCYKEFLIEKIDNMKENEPINFDDTPKTSFFKKFFQKFKK